MLLLHEPTSNNLCGECVLEKMNSSVQSKIRDRNGASRENGETQSRGVSVGCGTVVVFGLSWTVSGTPPDSNAWLIQRGDHRTEPTHPLQIKFSSGGLHLYISCRTVRQRVRKDVQFHRKKLGFVWLILGALHIFCQSGYLFNEANELLRMVEVQR